MRSGGSAWVRRGLACGGVVILVVGLAAPASAGRVERGLAEALAGPVPPEGLAVVVTLRRRDLPARGAARRGRISGRQQRVLDTVPAAAFQLKNRFVSLSGFAGQAGRGAIEALRRHPEVELVYLDGRVHATLGQGVPLINADDVWAEGYTGTGVNVAVLDTGIDTDHPDLSDDLVDEQCFCTVFLSIGCCPNGQRTQSGPGAAEDDEGHGTSVSGIITSGGVVADTGVAPDAGIVAVKVLGSGGGGYFSDIAAALDWVLTNHVALGVRVVNMSLGDGSQRNNPAAFPCTGTNLANAVEGLTSAGVAVFVSSGNDGHDNGISYPACVADAISVGGVYDADVGSVSWCGNASCTQILCTDNPTAADVFVCHSNSDEILDLLAPNYRTDTSALGGGTTGFGGTSASSPYAAAEGALLFEINPALTPAQVRDWLKTHGPQVTNPDNDLSFTRSDVRLAPEALGPTKIPALGRPGVALFLALVPLVGWRWRGRRVRRR